MDNEKPLSREKLLAYLDECAKGPSASDGAMEDLAEEIRAGEFDG